MEIYEKFLIKDQYDGKSETSLNIHLNNHRKGGKSQVSILVCEQFNNNNNNNKINNMLNSL